jgi:Gpi18-like mannosyltransferase
MVKADGPAQVAIVGVGLSHLAHFLSVLALYNLTRNVFGMETDVQRALSFISAALHIISPAGSFLSAPYGESVFSFLNILGSDIYLSAILDDGDDGDNSGKLIVRDMKLLGAAMIFAIATTIRSNGILNGCLFVFDASQELVQIASLGPSIRPIRRLFIIIVGGSIVALGMVGPQYLAYKKYCKVSRVSRPWCKQLIPSIYGWVQARYW